MLPLALRKFAGRERKAPQIYRTRVEGPRLWLVCYTCATRNSKVKKIWTIMQTGHYKGKSVVAYFKILLRQSSLYTEDKHIILYTLSDTPTEIRNGRFTNNN
jgi:hypothetical protein